MASSSAQTEAPPAFAGGPIDRNMIETAVWGPPMGEDRGDNDLTMDLNRSARAEARPERARRPAAVLCALAPRRGGFHVILTRRADHLSAHAGQVAFPGGKIDPLDPSPMAAALREAEEEIGLPREQVEVLGAIEKYATGTGFLITPFVALAHPAFHPIADDGEVAEVFEAPLDFLMDPSNLQKRSGVWRGETRHYYAYNWRGRTIWGATAGMLKCFADRMAVAQDTILAQRVQTLGAAG